ncbi:PREDICTED: structural maintenance of chromosomes protein 1A-like [Polistes canadensis]|uniref:structural maintenance of chromosomes protein 1A-like n=1 Tax=Polistes canadensis TaxID=91411 RepID=UPI000718EFD3|nr:PREDICTED: structural maintenance of chromosomes protein 1A-like [Polistes canadensis]XP_014597847.1 PREDICTED: structural maintenance of chromosomes protein 1A-like [Polistes canadensis]
MSKETEKREELLQQYIITTEVTLAEKKTLKHNLKDEIIQNNIIMEETVLKDLFPEVYGRLFTLCKPIHERYNIAVTKVLWNFKDAIVVETEKVARKCIDYLKQQQICVETFLPLDSLKIEFHSDQLRHNLRNMRNLQNVQLLYDVIEYFPKDISNAILFVTKNTLLCETSEDARRVAYEIHSNYRYACVALDGSYYQKSGLFSGGLFDLSTKATVWKDKQTQEMKLQKATLIEKMKEVSKCSKKQSELSTINSEICSLTNKLKYSRVDLDNIVSVPGDYITY